MKRAFLIPVFFLIVSLACSLQKPSPPTPVPRGVLVREIPLSADIMFSSIRYVLSDPACLDKNYQLKENFLLDGDCGKLIYDPTTSALASPNQLFTMDLETGKVIQITNTNCLFVSGQVMDSGTVMTNAVCLDDNAADTAVQTEESNLYLLSLDTGEMKCLTCKLGLEAINNPDYSPISGRIVFSARKGGPASLNHLFTIDPEKNLVQITGDSEYMDFDCSWSEDGSKIVFSRLPAPWFSQPSQVWLMNSDGTNMERITVGGGNPNDERPHGGYPIGLDADPDLSPDNSQIVFSRLKTGMENEPFGIYELIIIDVRTKEEHLLDSTFANMVPAWKSGGILLLRQLGLANVMERRQGIYLYKNGKFEEVEQFPYNVFPIGAYASSWIELK